MKFSCRFWRAGWWWRFALLNWSPMFYLCTWWCPLITVIWKKQNINKKEVKAQPAFTCTKHVSLTKSTSAFKKQHSVPVSLFLIWTPLWHSDFCIASPLFLQLHETWFQHCFWGGGFINNVKTKLNRVGNTVKVPQKRYDIEQNA